MILTERNGVPFYRSELIPCPHGFSTRIGGVSTEPHTHALNLGFGRGDEKATVLENLARFSRAVGVSPESVVSLPQVHGNEVLCVSREDAGEGYFVPSEREADGCCTVDTGVTLGIKTADCVPILLCGLSDGGTPAAVSALHAGWRGTVARIAERGVLALTALGIRRENIRAAIGPSIGVCCYEVDEAFYGAFRAEFGDAFLAGTILPRVGTEGKYLADLKEINRRILCSAGLREDCIDVSDACTFCRPEEFYSHRFSGGHRGTMLSVIALPLP